MLQACLAAMLMLTVTCGAERFVDQIHRADDLIERQVRHIVDQAELGRQPDEVAGRLDLAVLVTQANQRFDADHFLAADIDLGLERAAEAAVADGEPQPLLLLHPGGHRPRPCRNRTARRRPWRPP